MLPPPPTILTLGSEDMVEYEVMKSTWPKVKREGNQTKKPIDPVVAAHKKEVQDRIGFDPNNTK